MFGLSVVPRIMPAVEPVTMTDEPSGRCGIVTATVFITPSRSTSLASTNAIGSGLPIAIGRMPALATTMSILPRSARPASTRPADSWRSRTSATLAPLGRPISLTEPLRLGEIVRRRQRVRVRRDLPADVDGDDVGAFPGHRDRVCPALTSRRAGDERDFAFELSKSFTPS